MPTGPGHPVSFMAEQGQELTQRANVVVGQRTRKPRTQVQIPMVLKPNWVTLGQTLSLSALPTLQGCCEDRSYPEFFRERERAGYKCKKKKNQQQPPKPGFLFPVQHANHYTILHLRCVMTVAILQCSKDVSHTRDVDMGGNSFALSPSSHRRSKLCLLSSATLISAGGELVRDISSNSWLPAIPDFNC